MISMQPKVLTPLLLLRILEEYSDEKHPLTREEIERLLYEEYGIEMERKSFFRHMKALGAISEGEEPTDDRIADIRRVTIKPADPEKKSCAGFYLTDRIFTELELRIIIDALSGSSFLSQKETEELVARLARLGSRYFQRRMKSYQFLGRSDKTKNEHLMLNLEIIDEAITEHKQISFHFLRFNSHGEQEISSDQKEVCTPIRYFVKDRKYYLVAAKPAEEELLQNGWVPKECNLQLKAYTLSGIDKVEILDIPAHDYQSMPEFRKGMDWQKFIREHPTLSVLWYKPELCTFLCHSQKIGDIRARYGSDIRIRQLTKQEIEKLNGIFKEKVDPGKMVEVSVITDRYDAVEFARPYHFGLWVIYPKPSRGIIRSLDLYQLEYYDKLEQHYITGQKFTPINLSYNPLLTEEE